MDENQDVTNFQPQLSSTQLSFSEEPPQPDSGDVQKAYKGLMRKILQKDLETMSAAEFTIQEKEMLHDIMKESENLFRKSKTAQELVLDARVLKHISRICRQHAEELSLNRQKFRPNEFADKLLNKLGSGYSESGGAEAVSVKKWSGLGSAVQNVFNPVPSVTFLYGSFRHEPKPRKERVKRDVARHGGKAATQAKVVDFSNLTEDQATVMNSGSLTDRFVTSTFKQLVEKYRENDEKPLCYFTFVMDPGSFGVTVENVFYVSFLVKEGKASIFIDEEKNRPMIHPVKRRASSQREGDDVRKQVLFTVSLQQWEGLKASLNLETAVLTHRIQS